MVYIKVETKNNNHNEKTTQKMKNVLCSISNRKTVCKQQGHRHVYNSKVLFQTFMKEPKNV